MKIGIVIILLNLITINEVLTQRVLTHNDTTNLIAIDSTGYAEVHPHDIPEETGLFIYSADGREALRIYGSFRLLLTLDNKKNFHAYDLTQPTIPTGVNDYYHPNSNGNINMSRLGFDALLGSEKLNDKLIRIELDWKGDNEKFRVRHLFLRTEHWLIGKSWSSVNNISYLTQAIDGRFTGGAVGTRPIQIRYYNKIRKWKYQFSLEYHKSTLIQPDTLNAESAKLIPDLAGNISYKTEYFDIMFAGVVRMNRVQFTSHKQSSQSEIGYGGVFASRFYLNDRNRLMLSASVGSGMGGYLGDFAFVDIDLAYNPYSDRFENVSVYTALFGFEHDWSKQFTSAIGGSILGSEEKSFFSPGYFLSGSKIQTNLFYKPVANLGHLLIGVELEYAERNNISTPSNNTLRASTLLIYNF